MVMRSPRIFFSGKLELIVGWCHAALKLVLVNFGNPVIKIIV